MDKDRQEFDPTTFDGREWAKEFTRIAATKGITVDEDWMHTWFANAIMAGYDYSSSHDYSDRAKGFKAAKDQWHSRPTVQAWWWHWSGEDYEIPHIFYVMVSKTGEDRFFIEYPDSRWCDEVGGFWLRIEYPNVPTRDEQEAIQSMTDHGR